MPLRGGAWWGGVVSIQTKQWQTGNLHTLTSATHKHIKKQSVKADNCVRSKNVACPSLNKQNNGGSGAVWAASPKHCSWKWATEKNMRLAFNHNWESMIHSFMTEKLRESVPKNFLLKNIQIITFNGFVFVPRLFYWNRTKALSWGPLGSKSMTRHALSTVHFEKRSNISQLYKKKIIIMTHIWMSPGVHRLWTVQYTLVESHESS